MLFNRARQGTLGGGGGGGAVSYVRLQEPLILPFATQQSSSLSINTETMDAAAEKAAFIGQVVLQGGSGTKTISSAGGKIHWLVGASTTFANAGTTLRVGLQDLDAAGLPDGTFDVYDDLVGGTDTLTSSTMTSTTMSAGTKSVTHGTFLAIVADMTARGGADSVKMGCHTQLFADSSPMNVISRYISAAWGAAIAGTPAAVIEFDDGTLGWITLTAVHTSNASVSYNVNTAARDEYGNYFVPPFACKCGGVDFFTTPTVGATFEVCLYETPLTAPTLLEAKAINADDFTGLGFTRVMFAAEHTLVPASNYALTIRPTSTNNITGTYLDMSNPALAIVSGMDSDSCYAVARLDNTGAFADWNGGTAKSRRMRIGAVLTSIRAAQA